MILKISLYVIFLQIKQFVEKNEQILFNLLQLNFDFYKHKFGLTYSQT